MELTPMFDQLLKQVIVKVMGDDGSLDVKRKEGFDYRDPDMTFKDYAAYLLDQKKKRNE